MKNCYYCEAQLIQNIQSREHFIPESLGGINISRELLCIDCNSKLGSSIDAPFINEMCFPIHMLKINGLNPKYIVQSAFSETKYKVNNKTGKTSIIPDVKSALILDENNKIIGINASKFGNLENLTKYLNQLKKNNKYHSLDVKSVLSQVKQKYINPGEETFGPIQFNIGGDTQFLGALKIIINYYLHRGGDHHYVSNAINSLKQKDPTNIVNFGFKNLDTNENNITHTIVIIGDATQKLIYAYLDLFNLCDYIVLLSTNYTGVSFSFSYILDLDNKNVVQDTLSLSWDYEQIRQMLIAELNNEYIMQQKIERVMNIGKERGTAYNPRL